jgi:dTDP-4-dehydrorhamnose 3,5-epimerase
MANTCCRCWLENTSLEFQRLRIPDVKLLRPKVFGDHRGFFLESWNRNSFALAGLDVDFVQDNHSRSARHTLRGLHYQVQHTQGKLVRVTSGAVYDVAVDMRRSSPTFGSWIGAELSEANNHILWVPPGFAHGFLVLSESADFLYKCTDYYAPAHERTLLWNDPKLGIDWPLPTGVTPLIAQKDAAGSAFDAADTFP